MQVPLRAFCFTLFVVICVFLNSSNAQSLEERWEQWKQKHSKSYNDDGEHQRRKGFFQRAHDFINAHNSAGSFFKLGLNKFADKPVDELIGLNQNKHSFDKHHQLHTARAMPQSSDEGSGGGDIPVTSNVQAIDWRKKGAVAPVEEQLQCGSCWAFASAGAIEGQMAVKQQNLVPLSKQYLVDCDTGDNGCNGGWAMNAFTFAKQNGIPAASDYPYTAQQGSCQSAQSAIQPTSGAAGQYLPHDEDQLAAAVATIGPVAISINADDQKFYYYSSGVYQNPACDNTENGVDHGVLIVGFNNTNEGGGPYWIVKNSWGKDWGEEGYIRMAKGVNQCGLANFAMYPTFI